MPPIHVTLPELAPLVADALGLFALVLALAALVVSRRNRRQIERERARSEVGALEKAVAQLSEETDRLRVELASLQQEVERLRARQRRSFQAYALKRYTALGQNGVPPSQSLVLLTQEADGVVLTWIQTEHGCYVYAKGIEEGAPVDRLRLSEEEAETLQRALASLAGAGPGAPGGSIHGSGGAGFRAADREDARFGKESGHR
ncbi:MAG: DUF4446 family protein [Bacillota bacterium]|nr:DUF4446 family protein [Bacillota bacterium]